MTRRQARVLLAVALAVLVALPALALAARPQANVGPLPPAAVITPLSASAAEQPRGSPAPTPAATPHDPTPPSDPAPPARLRIPAIGVDTAIRDAGIEDDGSMEVPDDVAVVGWYRFGPAPGTAAGSAVLTAHVDSREQGPGAFFRLRDLAPGDRVEVTDADGNRHAFEVAARRRWPKEELPTAELFRRDGAPVLTLITCGGAFDASARRYADNVVVVAVPAA